MTSSRLVLEVDAACHKQQCESLFSFVGQESRTKKGNRYTSASAEAAACPQDPLRSLFLCLVIAGCWFVLSHGDPITAAEQPLPRAIVYAGMCDASAAVALDEHRFIVASDEDNTLRVYDRRIGGLPVARFDLSSFLKPQKKKNDAYRETDIEGAARLGDLIYWITSHGRNREGKQRPSRFRLFATKVSLAGGVVTLSPVGQPCVSLLDVLTDDPRLAAFDLSAAATRAPKSQAALNIEGLAATPDGRLLIGFRNPIPHRKALVVPLENPVQAIAGERPKLGTPLLINLEGRGIRSIDRHEKLGQYLITAGSYKAGGDFRLYLWDGTITKRPQPVKSVDFGKLGPEAIVVYPHQTAIQVLSDDGIRKIGGIACKEISDPTKRIFRDGWVRLPPVAKGR